MGDASDLLPSLTQAFSRLAAGPLRTAEFCDATARVLPLFDRLGTVFVFAKSELEGKRASLVAVQGRLPTLDALVAADVKAGTVAVKNSPARNLHRVVASLRFLAELLHNLVSDANATLRSAAGNAYGETLGKCHNAVLRAGVRAALYLLPDRAAFLASLGETEESARPRAAALVTAVRSVASRVEALYGGAKMPVSDVRFLPRTGGRAEAGAG